MPTAHIHIGGIVQGVGFRPFIFQTAQRLGLKGWVCNTSDGAHCRVSGSEASIYQMYRALVESPPPLAVVTSHSLDFRDEEVFEGFRIIESTSELLPNLILTPDVAMCADCRAELHDPANRRYRYPFITCTQCGPRYSIITGLPYDRPQTTMQDFPMCADCEAEYHDPTNRRHYSQTNSCEACGITMQLMRSLKDEDGHSYDDELISTDTKEILRKTVEYLREGHLVSVKGVGGFLVLGDAANSTVIEKVREHKDRNIKPLAVMYPTMEMLEADAFVSDIERAELESPAAPIVILRVRPETLSGLAPSGIAFGEIAPHLESIGAMLPYAPLYDLIARDFGKPLIATSDNEKGKTIAYENEDALDLYSELAEYTIVHDRDICLPQDDSVVRFTGTSTRMPTTKTSETNEVSESLYNTHRIVMRRARGFAPAFIQQSLRTAGALPESLSILAFGADVKNTFTLLDRGNVHLSQFLGDLQNYGSQSTQKLVLTSVLTTLQASPTTILVDEHPEYYSTALGEAVVLTGSDEPFAAHCNGATVVKIQHHMAHCAAVLAENNLHISAIEDTEPVLGVVWDGMGYGIDKNGDKRHKIWGGEFFLCKRAMGQHGTMERVGHLATFPHLQNNLMAFYGKIPAFALLHDEPEVLELLRPSFLNYEWQANVNAVSHPTGIAKTLRSSSVGRLFDAVAALLRVCECNSFEGESAMLVEAAAGRFFAKNGYNALEYTGLAQWQFAGESETEARTEARTETGTISGTKIVPPPCSTLVVKPLLLAIVRGFRAGASVEELSALFHVELVGAVLAMARFVAKEHNIRGAMKVAFSGGVFQNAVLVELLERQRSRAFQPFFHQQLSPNDENISFGQLMYHLNFQPS